MTTEDLIAVFAKAYAKEPFIKVYPNGALPEIKHVVHTNFCDIGLRVHEQKNLAVIVTAIDNLGKGAAGQAVQNMNIMCDLEETEGF